MRAMTSLVVVFGFAAVAAGTNTGAPAVPNHD